MNVGYVGPDRWEQTPTGKRPKPKRMLGRKLPLSGAFRAPEDVLNGVQT
jgi:hypothetical protein